MHELISFSLTVFMGFFAIMNPIANAPIFVGLTADMDTNERRAVALRSTSIAFLIVAAFAIGGHFVFRVFGIGLPAFRMTGGILIFLVGKHLLEGQKRSPVQSLHPTPLGAAGHASLREADAESDTAIAISPLAIPILAGPGTIACAVNFASGRTPLHIVICLLGFALLCAITFLVFMGGERLVQFLGRSAMSVISRLMGLILAVIGTQMFIEGLKGAFPGTFH